jgi:LacI family transcriptional regulator
VPTIRDVARACGLSAMTVSAVLNNKTHETSPETRERVLRKIEEMGYHPNAVARGLGGRRMNTLGIVIAYKFNSTLGSHRYLNKVMDGMFAANKEHHQKTLVINEYSWSDVEDNLSSYFDGHCDGFMFILPETPDEMFRSIQKRRFPFVLVGEDRDFPCVDLDNVDAGHRATKYLIERGHRRISLFRGSEVFRSVGQRERGYRQALLEYDITPEEELIFTGTYSSESGYERAEMISRWPVDRRPTAIFCQDDLIALGAIRGFRASGVRVPEDMSVIGVNDDETMDTSSLRITTIRNPFRQIGETAVENVLQQIGNKDEPAISSLLQGDLIVRDTVSVPASWFTQ